MSFAPHMTSYHLPDSGGSYMSRIQFDYSNILLNIAVDEIDEYKT